MNAMLLLASCLFDRARSRARAAVNGSPESGALSLEWILIAVAIVAAAGVVAVAVKTAINAQIGGL